MLQQVLQQGEARQEEIRHSGDHGQRRQLDGGVNSKAKERSGCFGDRNEGGGGLGSTSWRSARGDGVLAEGVDKGILQGGYGFRIRLVIRLVKI